jgi:hypothetical protein
MIRKPEPSSDTPLKNIVWQLTAVKGIWSRLEERRASTGSRETGITCANLENRICTIMAIFTAADIMFTFASKIISFPQFSFFFSLVLHSFLSSDASSFFTSAFSSSFLSFFSRDS